MARFVYLLGAGYSGSTLFAFLANAHSRIVSVGEATGPVRLDDRPAYACSCGATLGTCPFWKRVGEAMSRWGKDFGPERWDLAFRVGSGRIVRQLAIQSLRDNTLDAVRDALVARAPHWGALLHETALRNEAFVESVLEVSGKHVFLDASKDPARARLLHRLTDLDLRIVHLVRDAPGQVSSRMKNKRASLESSVRYWSRTVGHAARAEALLPAGRFLRVRYEDLCRSPEDEMARLARFVGVEPEPLPADFRSSDHHIIGNRMRVAGVGSIVLDESWRERLSPEQMGTIERRTASQRRRLGYC